jgi:predicted amidohydrolase YtcJ
VGVLDGRIVGVDGGIEREPADRTVDARGATVLPGFVDAHTHLVWQGTAMRATDISGAGSVDEALHLVDAAARAAQGDWVDVGGYDQRGLGRHLTAADLDAVSHGHRVLVVHLSGHACVVNSAVLADVPAAELARARGVDRDGAGRATGLFLEMGQNLVREQRLPYSMAEVTDAIMRSTQLCARQGVTSCSEAGIGAGLFRHSPVELAAYQQLQRQGRLPIRVRLMVAGDFLHPLGHADRDTPDLGLDLGMHTGFGGDRLALGAVKLWLDGGMAARTAALTEPYVGTAGRGELAEDIEGYRDVVLAAHEAGWQLALHAIGDRAVDAALGLIEECLSRYPRADARPRIEHCGLVRPDQLDRLAAAGIIAVVQPTFLREWGEDYSAIMGAHRAGWLYRGRQFLDRGIRLSGSSDRPVTSGAPLEAISFMLTRRTRGGGLIGPDEAITIGEALRAYTADAAYACGTDDRVGSITVGRLADLCMLGADPHGTPPDRIGDIPVKATIVDGAAVFSDGDLFPPTLDGIAG